MSVSSLFDSICMDINLLALVVCVFLYAISYRVKISNPVAMWGCNYSLYIYIFHLLIMSVMQMFAIKMSAPLNGIYMMINPVMVFILSTLLTIVLIKLKIIK